MNYNSEIIQYLHALPCLSGLGADELDIKRELSSPKKIPKNSILFEESDPVKFFFIVRSGSIKLYKISPEGRELTVKIFGSGDYFCCAPLYAGERYFVSAVPLEDSSLIVIPPDDFKELICGSMGDMGLKIIAGLCGSIRYLSTLVEDLTFKDVEQRLMEQYGFLTEHITKQTQLLRELSETPLYRERVEILCSVPGIRLIAAMELLVELQDVGRFRRAEQLAAYVGLTPSQYSRAEKIRMGRIMGAGKNGLRAILVEAS